MKILVINNNGAGFADTVEVAPGTTVKQIVELRIGAGTDPKGYLIRVNRQPAAGDTVLNDGDRVSITPVKIEGAA